jgi:hypothetical protein
MANIDANVGRHIFQNGFEMLLRGGRMAKIDIGNYDATADNLGVAVVVFIVLFGGVLVALARMILAGWFGGTP